MATVTTTVPKWTEKEKQLAEKILREAQNYSGSFFQKYGNAAKACGYDNYGELPQGTKKFISTLGGKKGGKVSKKA